MYFEMLLKSPHLFYALIKRFKKAEAA